jgi:hypothetical protein
VSSWRFRGPVRFAAGGGNARRAACFYIRTYIHAYIHAYPVSARSERKYVRYVCMELGTHVRTQVEVRQTEGKPKGRREAE